MIKPLDFDGMWLRSKVPVPFVEDNFYMPATVFVEGYFPAGTVFQFQTPVCSKRINEYDDQVNDYCHAVALLYSSRFKGNESPDDEGETRIVFHVDLSALFLLMEPIDENGNALEL